MPQIISGSFPSAAGLSLHRVRSSPLVERWVVSGVSGPYKGSRGNVHGRIFAWTRGVDSLG